jgi:hypothetical protein
VTGQKKPQGRGNGAGASKKNSLQADRTAGPCDKSTSTKAQIERLLRLLELRPRHTHELRQFGISHPAARCLDLKKRGYLITSSRVSTVDSDSYTHRGVALYSLQGEPEGSA